MGVAEPYDKIIFAFSCVVLLQATLYVMRSLKSIKLGGGKTNYRFNNPDFSELNSLNLIIKKINQEIEEIKKKVEVHPDGRNQELDQSKEAEQILEQIYAEL